MRLPSANELRGKWNQHVGAAKIVWGKLIQDELLKSEGHQQRLSGLVQARFAISRKQVRSFLEKCRL